MHAIHQQVSSLDFLRPLVDDMVNADPESRPSMDEACKRLEDLATSLVEPADHRSEWDGLICDRELSSALASRERRSRLRDTWRDRFHTSQALRGACLHDGGSDRMSVDVDEAQQAALRDLWAGPSTSNDPQWTTP